MKPNYLFKTRRQAIARARRKYSIKDYTGAIAEWEELLERNEDDALAWLGRFDCLLKLERKDEMLQIGDRVCELWPQSEAAHNNFACILLESRQYEKACQHFDTALAIAPERNMYYFNAGLAYKGAGKLNEAAICFEHVLEQEPEHQRALEFLSQLYLDFGLGDKLIDLSMRLRMLRPGYTFPLQRRLFAMMNNPDIPELEIAREVSLMRSALVSRPDRKLPNRPVKVAWLLCSYSLRYLRYVLPAMKRYRQESEFEFVALVNNPSLPLDECKNLFDHVYATESSTLDAFKKLLEQYPIDVLIDSAGQMPNNLLQFYSARIAPLQISWPFFQSRTELALMDQAFVDEHIHPVIPEQNKSEQKNVINLSDRLTHLPTGQHFYDGDDTVALTVAPIEQNGFVTFGVVADPIQINQQSAQAIAAIVKSVPNSNVKIIHHLLPSTLIERQLGQLFEIAGLHADQVSYLPRSSLFSKRYECFTQVDILLSPFPLTDDMALLDALWMGVPVLAMANTTIGQCRAASILSAADLTEYLTDSIDAYVNRGIELASNKAELPSARRSLRARLKTAPITQVQEFVEYFFSRLDAL
ncbi:MAG: tetratricopeptide repeat protein [Acidiferrobacterales bacterium]|nr:tetratricopeptide repeat protein [Acidiferrobacterales bacterium]